MKVELSEEADGQVKRIDVWWRANRLAAPDLFTNELEAALTTLSEIPTLGVKYDTGKRSLRRLLLRRSHYHLYFAEEADRVYIVAVWNAFRGRGPRL